MFVWYERYRRTSKTDGSSPGCEEQRPGFVVKLSNYDPTRVVVRFKFSYTDIDDGSTTFCPFGPKNPKKIKNKKNWCIDSVMGDGTLSDDTLTVSSYDVRGFEERERLVDFSVR